MHRIKASSIQLETLTRGVFLFMPYSSLLLLRNKKNLCTCNKKHFYLACMPSINSIVHDIAQ